MKIKIILIFLCYFIYFINAKAEKWQSTTLPNPNSVFCMDFSRNNGIAAGFKAIWHTQNSGDSWEEINTPYLDDYYFGVDILGNNDVILVGYANTTDTILACVVIKTTDWGLSWVELFNSTNFQPGDISFVDRDHIIVSVTQNDPYGASVLSSTNGGSNWSTYFFGGETGSSIAITPSSSVYIGGWSGVWKQSHTGWENIGDVPASDMSYRLLDSTLWSVGFRMVGRYNQGNAWNVQVFPENITLRAVAFNDNVGYLVGDTFNISAVTDIGYIYKNIGSSSEWEKIYELPNEVFSVVRVNESYVFVATFSGLILRAPIPVIGIENNIEKVINYSLLQNSPNPFNPTTLIKYIVPKKSSVTIKIYDVMGREIQTLINGYIEAGTHEVEFTGVSLSSGVYFYKLSAGNFTETKKMILLK